MKIEIGISKDVGTKYKQSITKDTPSYVNSEGFRMEDAIEFKQKKSKLFLAIADGHGSVKHCDGLHVGGYECAQDSVKQAIFLSPITIENADESYKLIHKYHQNRMDQFNSTGCQVKKITDRNTTYFKLGTNVMNHGCTLSTLFIDAEKKVFHFTNIGDSVGIWVKQNGNFEILSVLHTRKNKEENSRVKKDGGLIVGDRWFEYKIANHGYNSQLSRSIGHFGNDAIIQTPHKITNSIETGDKFILATDGLWDYVSYKESAEIVLAARNPTEASEVLVNLSNDRASRKKRKDNTTVACVFTSSKSFKHRVFRSILNLFS